MGSDHPKYPQSRRGSSGLCVALAALLALAAGQSQAGEITLDPGGARAWDFTAIGGGQLRVCTVNCIWPIVGAAYYVAGGDTGAFTFGPADFIAGPEVGGVFPANGTETFDFASAAGDAVSGLVTWHTILDGSLSPSLVGTLDVLASVGDLAGEYPAGSTADVIATVAIECSLSNLVAGLCPTGIQETPLATGSINPRYTPVPEPSSLALLLMAGLGWLWWRVLT